MSEWYDQPTDGSDELMINFGDTEFRMTRYNTALFTFLGLNAMYDHVFFQRSEPDEVNQVQGTYLFKEGHSDSFEKITDFIVNHAYPMHINGIEVADCDRDAYVGMIERELSRGVPDEWTKPDAA